MQTGSLSDCIVLFLQSCTILKTARIVCIDNLVLRILKTAGFDFIDKLVKSVIARTPQWRINYHSLWGQLSTAFSNATEVAQWAAPRCSGAGPQPAADNGVRDGRSN